MFRNCREDVPDVREWSGDPPGCPGVFGRPSRMSGCGRETLPNVREWSCRPPECLGVVVPPSWMSGSGWEALSDVRKALPYAW